MTCIRSATREDRDISATSDDGSDITTISSSSSAILVLARSGSTSSSALIPTAYVAPDIAPSVTGSTSEVPSLVDVEDILTNNFSNLTVREKQRALAAVGKFPHCDSTPSSAFTAETEIWPEVHAAKTYNNRDTSNYGNPHNSIKRSLADWQALCRAVGVAEDKVPNSITKCKKVRRAHNQPYPPPNFHQQTLKAYNTNLSDLSNALRNGTVAQTFPSVAALAHYTRYEGKIMSKTVAKKDPLLKEMMRGMFRGGKGRRK
jgi:hypothetical protein